VLRVGQLQRWHWKFVLAREVECRAAGYEHLQPSAGRQQLGQQWSGSEHLLEIVQHQEQ
jgi:hypothetical protein